ncbi:MAG: polyribonucleotide nucleotidyltransferase [Acidobacteria bacterium RIFCSPLOWO2_12_FULL_67_14]|nr:MAG: polyribonucleotide nucleotidyltransferase [Acidobacteria bacterium RIFCSPLOWO2_02_FULL_67_21]OFW38540.1 MAG: polyribonucleotide nucleotidyltransferase [Acidobacteria bacterium RIFCSPLOWO2_12_FULL_67_14]
MHNVNLQRREIQIGTRTISLESGKIAKQADGAVLVRSGDTVVLVTACRAANAREGIDFLPLTVDYREYTYASGRIPGGFFKREGKPTEKEVLTSRLIDRPIRPLFAPGWRYETQVISLLLSADTENDSDVLAITGASAALALSAIPFQKTIAGVRVGLVSGQFVINPTFAERKESRLDLIVAGSKDGIVMVEAGAKEVTEAEAVGALEAAHAAIKQIVAGIDALAAAAGKKKVTVQKKEIGHDFYREVEEKIYAPLSEAMRIRGKLENYDRVDQVLEEFVASIPEGEIQRRIEAKHIFHELKEKVLRDEVLERGVRLDGRKFDEIRPIWTEASVLPRTHGSVIFTRGETQALVTCTLGTADDEQKIEHVSGEFYKRFMLHYNFPPFSVGEVAFMRGPGRREVGHGALAERALTPVVPGEDKFAYTIRIVSDILESNGSSSMASVCGGSMAMMDAGVPLSAPVAGIAMGLIMDEKTGKFAVLSDIAGAEDHYGDMDFKVAGTGAGITALQMDIKVSGVTADVMRKALEQARQGRLHILAEMARTLAEPRQAMSAFAPRIVTIRIPVDKIRDVIGPGGKMIRSIIERTGVKIDVEDDGRVNVASSDGDSAQKAIGIIQELTATPELNKTYMGKVQRITDFGAFVEIMPGTDGLLHVSEIATHRVKDVRDELKEGQQILVKVINIDPTGKIRLSRKALLQDEAAKAGEAAAVKE